MINTYLFYPQYQDGNPPFITQWLPYSVAAVWAYVDQFSEIKENFKLKEIIFKREPIDTVVSRLDNPGVCLFSNYLWNENYNLLLAKQIKKRYPKCLIVFGGPNVHNDGYTFLKENSQVDCAVTNEGEYNLYNLLIDHLNNKVKSVYNSTKRVNAAELPSPYVDKDYMDNIVKNNPESKWAMVLETNRGCPFNCTFCDWGSLTQSKIKQQSLDRVFREIDWLCKNNVEYVYIADANFGIFYERDLEIVKYFCKKKLETGYPYIINVNWYKNSKKNILHLSKLLNEIGLNRGITLSVQSMNKNTLEVIKRSNMEISQLEEMYRLCNENNLRFYTEFIIGLPNETLTSWKNGISRAVELGCHTALDIYPLEILRNSELSKHVSDYNMEVVKFDSLMPNQESNIVEFHKFVIKTTHMSQQDFISGWMWGWVIYNFHHCAWLQAIQRFLYKDIKIGAREFYETFLEQCVLKNDFLKSEYYKHMEYIKDMFYSNNSELNRGDVQYWAEQHTWYYNRDYIHNIISEWLTQYLLDIGYTDLIIKNLIKFNSNFNVDRTQKQEYVIEYNFNLYDFIQYSNVPLKKKKILYKYSNNIDWESNNEFDHLVYRRQRQGFLTKKIIRKTE